MGTAPVSVPYEQVDGANGKLHASFPLTCRSSFEKSTQLDKHLVQSESRQPVNANYPEVEPKTFVTHSKADSAKLLSLLALASGAVAMPQTSNADITFVDLSANPVHVGPQSGASYIINTLPGDAQLGFHTSIRGTQRLVKGGQDAGYVRIKTVTSLFFVVNAGKAWNTVGGNTSVYGFAGTNKADRHRPTNGDYNDKYLLFEFRDSTQPGSPMRFGWVELSLAVSVNGNPGQPDLTIEGYAWETTGVALASGQVPEPSASALLALGAMTLGAKGLRSWRKNRPAGTKP
jgi:hypothetical protein